MELEEGRHGWGAKKSKKEKRTEGLKALSIPGPERHKDGRSTETEGWWESNRGLGL